MTDLTITNTQTISSDVTFDNVYVNAAGVLIVGAVLTVTNHMEIQPFGNVYANPGGYIIFGGSGTGSGTGSNPTGSPTPVLDTGGLFDSFGNPIQNIFFTDIIETTVYKNVVLEIPFSNADVIQGFGLRNRTYRITGESVFSLASTRLALLAIDGTPGYLVTDVIPQTNVLFQNLDIKQKAGRPFEFVFSMDAVEIK
jgi:hypothetical protein